MKTKLILLLCVLCASVVLSTAAVQIDSLTQIKLDGQAAGDLANALRQNPTKANAILDALEARELAASAEIARLQAALQAASTAHEAALQAKDSEISNLKSEIAGLSEAKSAAESKLAALVPLLDVVEASALAADHKAALRAARKSEAERKRETLQAQRAALDAELAKLQGK
jgi:chromosome segregation ATPase